MYDNVQLRLIYITVSVIHHQVIEMKFVHFKEELKDEEEFYKSTTRETKIVRGELKPFLKLSYYSIISMIYRR